MTDNPRFYEAASGSAGLRSAPAALRNREPIADVLREWLPESGCVLELASGTGEHALFFAERFPNLTWQPSDVHPEAVHCIRERLSRAALSNIREPLTIDAAAAWPIHSGAVPNNGSPEAAGPSGNSGLSAVLCINMVHISPWRASLGLLAGAAKALYAGGALILYGPWLKANVPTAPSNLAFDQQLRERDPDWGLREVETFEGEAVKRGFVLGQVRTMPANNLMLLFRLAV